MRCDVRAPHPVDLATQQDILPKYKFKRLIMRVPEHAPVPAAKSRIDAKSEHIGGPDTVHKVRGVVKSHGERCVPYVVVLDVFPVEVNFGELKRTFKVQKHVLTSKCLWQGKVFSVPHDTTGQEGTALSRRWVE
jgi:hypothetical protein